MGLILDFYRPGRSWLHRLDPRVKLWGMVLGLLLAFLLPSTGAQALFFLAILLLLRGNGIPWNALHWLWRQIRFLCLLILFLQPFFTPSGETLVALGPLRLTLGGVNHALGLTLRVLTMSFLTGGLLFTTEQRQLVRAFVHLGVPYTWGLTLSLTLRFLPAISSLLGTVREAQAARGWVAEGNLFRRAREYLPVLVAVTIGTLRMGDQLTLALAARGLGTASKRTTWRDIAMRPADWRALVGVSVAFLAVMGLLR